MIDLDQVSKHYPGAAQPALHPTTLSIGKGEFFSILGPSGSGKTTTLRLIAGFERPDSGIVNLANADVTQLPPNKRDVNTVFQNYALFPHLNIFDNVAYPLRMKRVRGADIKARVEEALSLVEMSDFRSRLPHQLSGGQRQRIALARALVGRPQVLLLDEPLGALDLRLRQQMQHVLTSLQEQLGITFVYVTHDQGEALSMSDRVAIMNHGRIEQIGSPEDLYYSPKSEFVAAFVGKSNLLDVQIEEGRGFREARIAGHAIELPQARKTGRAKLVVRCESLAVTRSPDHDAAVSLPATVENVLFLGTGLEIILDCQGVTLTALVTAQRERQFATGDTVYCSFKSSDVVVLHD
ncbi:ABC transporter ATP-binding protein [Caballeronia megalochromosomata]|nr:ABC transporter ATP-binding protein [Caballeronia megalochromosomata]